MTTKLTKAEAAKLAAEAKLTEAASTLADVSGLAAIKLMAASTKAEHMAAAAKAAAFVADAEADAFWLSIVPGRMEIGRRLYEAAKAEAVSADANVAATFKAAADYGFAATMSALGFGTKSTYEALEAAKRPGPGRRSWSALAEDFSLFAYCAEARWQVGYEASLSDDSPSVRGYLTFSRQAEAKAAADAEAKGTPQSRGAVTKTAQREEAKRQAEAAAEAKTKREADAAKAASDRIAHISDHPSAAIVEGFPQWAGSDLTECFDIKKLDAVIATIKAWRDHVAAMSADERKAAAEAAAAPKADAATTAIVAEAAAEAAAAPKAEADAEAAMLDALAERLMARMAAK